MADSDNQLVRKVSLSTSIISTAISESTCLPEPCIPSPRGLAFDAAGNLFVSSWSSSRVFVWNASTSDVTVFAGNGNDGYSGDLGAATLARLSRPAGLAIYQEALFIADGSRIRKVDLSTNIITTVAGGGLSGDGQVATDASLSGPESLLFDSSGNMFIGNGMQIRRVDAVTHIISTYAGKIFDPLIRCILSDLLFSPQILITQPTLALLAAWSLTPLGICSSAAAMVKSS